jgi:hypothetical protein
VNIAESRDPHCCPFFFCKHIISEN